MATLSDSGLTHTYDLAADYELALRDYLRGEGEHALQRVHDLSRRMVADGRGILEISAAHNRALSRILDSPDTTENAVQILDKAADFLVEGLTPFEMKHRAFRESNLGLRHLNETLEGTIRRIAHSLHDEAGQLTAALHVALKRIAEDLPAPARERVAALDPLLEDVGQSLRRLSHELRPTALDDLGLMPALRLLIDGVSTRSGIPIALEGSLRQRLEPAQETALYRIVQDGLNHLVRHSRASAATVRITMEGRWVQCCIRGAGAGFDAGASGRRKGPDLIGIRGRVAALGGTLIVVSGAELSVSIPVTRRRPAAQRGGR